MSNRIEYPLRNLDQKTRNICYKKCVTLQLKVVESSVGVSMVSLMSNSVKEQLLFLKCWITIPSHNLDCERHLAISSIHIENTSECLNCHFKAWSTADNAILHKFSQVKRIKRDIKEILDHVNRSGMINKKA